MPTSPVGSPVQAREDREVETARVTVEVVRDVLDARPGLDKRELVAALASRGLALDTHELNAFLYSHQQDFEWHDGPRGRQWSVRPALGHGQAGSPPAPPTRHGNVGLHRLDLFPWQERALQAWRQSSSRGVVEAVTGAGKTRLALQAMIDALDQGRRVAVLVPTLELMRQWAREISVHVQPCFGGRCRVTTMGGGGASDLSGADVLVATASSAARYRLLPPGQAGLLIADECHHYGAEMWSRALEPEFEARLGLTATYSRDDSGLEAYLDPYFGGLCYRVGYEEALTDGVIARFRIAFIGVAFSALEREQYEDAAEKARRYRGRLVNQWGLPAEPFGEFMREVQRLRHAGVEEGSKLAGFYLSAFSKRRQIMAGSIAKQHAVRDLSPAVADAQRTIVFAQTVSAANGALLELRNQGHVGSVIEATMDRDERVEAFEAFERGDYNVVAAPRLLDEGVDVPAADLAIVLATSRSRRQLIQRMGRVVRKKSDGRSARLAILFVEGTAEDPRDGAHEDFLDDVVDVAEDVAIFPADTDSREIVAYLRPHGWSRGRASTLKDGQSASASHPPSGEDEPSWLSDLLVDLESVVPGCVLRHQRFGVGTVLAVRDGGKTKTIKAEFEDGTRDLILGSGHLEFVV